MDVHGKASDFHPTSQILHFFFKIGKIHVTKKKHFFREICFAHPFSQRYSESKQT